MSKDRSKQGLPVNKVNEKELRDIKFEQAWNQQLQEMIEKGWITVTINEDGEESFQLTKKGFEEAQKMKDPDTGEPLVTKEHEERWKEKDKHEED